MRGSYMMLRTVLSTSTLLAATACVSAPGKEMLDNISMFRGKSDGEQSWSASDLPSAPPRGDWIASFGDPALSALIAEALENNYDLAAAAARLEQARASARVAGAPRLPRLDARLDRSQNEFAVSGAIPTTDVNGDGEIDQNDVIADPNSASEVVTIAEANNAGLGVSASWEADVWGRVRDVAKAGQQDAFAAQANFDDAQLSLAGSVARGWYDLIQARLLTLLAEDDVATQERSLRLTRRRFEAGLATSLDVRLARSSLASSEANLLLQQNLENNAARSLEVLLGRYPSAEINAADALPQLPELETVGAPGELLARRPDLRSAEASLQAAGFRASAARKALMPQLTLTATYGTDGEDFSEAFDPDYLVSRLAGSLLQPVFRGGALLAESERAKQSAYERLAIYANTALAAFNEAEAALDAETTLAARDNALAIAVEEALAAEELAEREYSRGVGTIFDLLNAQSRRISAERQLIAVRRDRVVNRVNLYVAIGGDFLTDFESDPATAAQLERAL